MSKLILSSTDTERCQRLIEDMSTRGFSEKSRHDYIRSVAGFAAFLAGSPDTATAEGIRRFQIHQSEQEMHPPATNNTVAALRFFFTYMLDRPDTFHKLIRLRYARKDAPGHRHCARLHWPGQAQICSQSLRLQVLFLKLPQLAYLCRTQPAILLLPAKIRRLGNPHLAADLRHNRP